tara:strand:+ start:594 stop:1205 length:612 start_codon:yes stop_codon:yes gene_type:complete
MLLNLPIKDEIKIWLYSKNLPLKPITAEELKWEKLISAKNFQRYHHSRGYIRYSLSNLLEIPALEIPLNAKPGTAPKLGNNLGYLSLSHSSESILIAWAPKPIGIDFEMKKRIFSARRIHDRILLKSEKKAILARKNNFKENVLKFWIIKEAAFKWQIDKENIDLFHWEWIIDNNYAFNKKNNQKVKTYLLNYHEYFMGIAYD